MFERTKEMNLEVIRDEFSTFIDNKECKMSQIKVEIPFGNTPNKKMKFSISHSHLNDGDYCWAINNKGCHPAIELVQLHYNQLDKNWYLDRGTETTGYLFGNKIEVPDIWEFLGQTWKMNKIPFCPVKIENQ